MKKIKHLLKMTIRVYRERGLASLISRVFSYVKDIMIGLFYLLKYSNDYDVLYVSGCPGGSRFYRCYNQSEELGKYGIRSGILSQDNIFIKNIVKKFKIFVFQRVVYNSHIKEVIEEIKKQNKLIVYETDDLVFDPKYIPDMHYYNFMSKREKGWYENGIGREILEDKYVKNCVVSTDYLYEKLKEKYPDKNIFISYNKLSDKQIFWANNALNKKDKIKPKDGKIRIGYFSGSKSHDNDFETISKVLLKILKENKKAVLMLAGHLDVNKDFFEVKDQIEKIDFVPIKRFSELLLRADINIAPLESDNPFCQSKSALKYFESGLVGVPTVATATKSFRKVIDNGKNGFLAESEDGWYEYLKELIENKELRESMGKRAKEDSFSRYASGNEGRTSDFVEFIKKYLKNFSKEDNDGQDY